MWLILGGWLLAALATASWWTLGALQNDNGGKPRLSFSKAVTIALLVHIMVTGRLDIWWGVTLISASFGRHAWGEWLKAWSASRRLTEHIDHAAIAKEMWKQWTPPVMPPGQPNVFTDDERA